MSRAFITFHNALNDFLPARHQYRELVYEFLGRPGVKDAIEGFGIPHVEVGMIVVNGKSATFGYHVGNGDFISVFPLLRGRYIWKTGQAVKFILDTHLGKLAKYLRMLGFDSFYRNDLDDKEIIVISLQEDRIILTRDVGILKHERVSSGYYLRSQDPKLQLREVVDTYQLASAVKLFTRCIDCNGLIKAVSKESVRHLLEPNTLKYFDVFFQCADCKKVYWKGSHYERMMEFISNRLHR